VSDQGVYSTYSLVLTYLPLDSSISFVMQQVIHPVSFSHLYEHSSIYEQQPAV